VCRSRQQSGDLGRLQETEDVVTRLQTEVAAVYASTASLIDDKQRRSELLQVEVLQVELVQVELLRLLCLLLLLLLLLNEYYLHAVKQKSCKSMLQT